MKENDKFYPIIRFGIFLKLCYKSKCCFTVQSNDRVATTPSKIAAMDANKKQLMQKSVLEYQNNYLGLYKKSW